MERLFEVDGKANKLLVTKAATKFCTHNEPAAPSLSLLMLLAEFFSDKYVIGA